jgi:two-component system cell cycle sensor histidine kinase/response regulator CckA
MNAAPQPRPAPEPLVQTVLLVDDDPIQLKLNARLLGDAGFRVVTARNGNDALEMAGQVRLDAIVSDVIMGDLDGFGVCQRLRANPALDAVPILLISAHFDDEDDRVLAARVGANALVQRSPEFDAELAALRLSLSEGARVAAPRPGVTLDAERLERLAFQLSSVAERVSTSEARFRRLVERLPDVVWSATVDGAFTFVSPNIEQVIGYTADEVQAGGLAWWRTRIHPEDEHTIAPEREAFFESDNHGSFDVQYRFQRKDGSWAWLRSRSSSRYHGAGVVSCDGLFSDVTQQRQLEEGLRQAQKLEAVGMLAGGIAHDFNNILSVIISAATFLSDEMPPGDERRADAEEVVQMAQRAATLTRQLLAFSRREIVRPEVFAIEEGVADLSKMLTRLIGEDVGLVVAAVGAAPGLVRLDRGHFEQIVVNLVVNARDAMPGGGQLRLRTGRAQLPTGWTGARTGPVASGAYVTLTVEDEGQGMTPEVAARIFEPFYTTKGPGKGTGLGLSTVYGIVQQAAGAIAMESAPGRGTSFTIYLPEARAQQVTARKPTAPDVRPRGHETILLVEDEDLVRAVCRRALTSAGYQVLEARNGNEARALVARGGARIQLVLTDVVMPSGSGPDLVAALHEVLPGLKVLYMSGYSEHPVLRVSMVDSAVDFIQKPFTPGSLVEKVRDALASG